MSSKPTLQAADLEPWRFCECLIPLHEIAGARRWLAKQGVSNKSAAAKTNIAKTRAVLVADAVLKQLTTGDRA